MQSKTIRNSFLFFTFFYFLLHLGYLVWVYFFTDGYPSEKLIFSYTFTIYIAVIYALMHDNRIEEGFSEPYDLGFLIWMSWPIFVPYYLYKTRRWFAVPLIGLLVGVFWIDAIVALIWEYSLPS